MNITRKALGAGVFVAAIVVAGVIGQDAPRGPRNERVVDCYAIGIMGLPDGGPRWSGCNVLPVEYAIGDDCIPAPCAVEGQDAPEQATAEEGKSRPEWRCVIPRCDTQDFK
jgi:hypothetical protein